MGKHEQTNEKKKIKKKKRHLGRKIFLIILIILFIMGIVFAKRVYDLEGNWIAALLGHNKNTLQNIEEIRFVILGESTGNTDTIIICSYDPKVQKASMLSIPRDTFTGENTNSARAGHKINSLYSNGTTPEKTLAAINNITGLDIKNYILVDSKALIKLVDIIGGVEFDVPIDMQYDDYSQDLHVNLKAGVQTLTGEQVEQVVRFRHNNDGSTYPYEYGIEDYGRMKTQRNLIKAIAKQTLQFKNIKEINKIIDLSSEYVKSNMSVSMVKDYIPYAIKMNLDEVKMEQLPGESKLLNGIWFFLPDKKETETIVDELFNNNNVVINEDENINQDD